MKRLLTTEEVGTILNRSRQSVYNLIHAHQLRAKRIGREWMFREEWVNDFIDNEAARVPPMPVEDRRRLKAAQLN